MPRHEPFDGSRVEAAVIFTEDRDHYATMVRGGRTMQRAGRQQAHSPA